MMKFYRDQAKNLPPAGPWANEAKQWWKDNHPALHHQLQRAGQLDNAARVAEANARDHYADLVSQGADPRAAEEQAKSMYIHPEGDPPQTPEDRQAGEQTQVSAFEKWLSTLPKGDKDPNDEGQQVEAGE